MQKIDRAMAHRGDRLQADQIANIEEDSAGEASRIDAILVRIVVETKETMESDDRKTWR